MASGRIPAKFPETLAQEFIEFFTKQGQVVFDPMAGTGSALIAALRAGRRAIGVELSPEFTLLAQERLATELARLELPAETARLSRATPASLPTTTYRRSTTA